MKGSFTIMGNNDKGLEDYPTSVPIKVMGENSRDFELMVFEAVQRHVPDLSRGDITSRLSRGGNYISVTVTFSAKSRAHLEAIYKELKADDRVLMLL